MLDRGLGNRTAQWAYHQLLLRLYRHEPLYTTAIGDRALRFSTPDPYSTIWFYSLLRKGGLHEPPVTEAMAKAAASGPKVFADVGSHLGYYSCVVAAAAPSCEVVAFEMNADLVPVIRANLALNGRPEAEVVHAAVGAGSGRASYEQRATDPGLRVTFDDDAGDGAASVGVVSLDDHFAGRPLPDLVKIDVEGAEADVLRGAKKLLEQHRPILFLEVHPQALPQFGSSIEHVLQTVWDAGYQIEAFDEHRRVQERMVAVRSPADVGENIMLRCTPDR